MANFQSVWCAKHFIMGYIFSSDASKNLKPLFHHPGVIQSWQWNIHITWSCALHSPWCYDCHDLVPMSLHPLLRNLTVKINQCVSDKWKSNDKNLPICNDNVSPWSCKDSCVDMLHQCQAPLGPPCYTLSQWCSPAGRDSCHVPSHPPLSWTLSHNPHPCSGNVPCPPPHTPETHILHPGQISTNIVATHPPVQTEESAWMGWSLVCCLHQMLNLVAEAETETWLVSCH